MIAKPLSAYLWVEVRTCTLVSSPDLILLLDRLNSVHTVHTVLYYVLNQLSCLTPNCHQLQQIYDIPDVRSDNGIEQHS